MRARRAVATHFLAYFTNILLPCSTILLALALATTDASKIPIGDSREVAPRSGEKISTAPQNKRDAEDAAGPNEWPRWAVRRLWEERRLMGRTPVVTIEHIPGIRILFKDESAARSGSLKHRFAWALFLWAVVEGHIRNGTTVYEASSGNSAFAEAHMARLLGVPFVTVVPDSTEPAKLQHIAQTGARIIKVPLGEIQSAARELAANDTNGFFMNQYGNAEFAEEYHRSYAPSEGVRSKDQHESSNLFDELLQQMNGSAPHYFVHSAGTGGTITAVGRYIKKYGLDTEVVFADSEFSLYYEYVVSEKFKDKCHSSPSRCKTTVFQTKWMPPGLGASGFKSLWGVPVRGYTSSLVPSVVDHVMRVPDLASVAAMQVLSERFGISGGPSTGLNFIAALEVAAKKRGNGSASGLLTQSPNIKRLPVTIATLICDSGRNYEPTYHNRTWLAEHFLLHGGLRVLDSWRQLIGSFLHDATFYRFDYSPLERGVVMCS